MKYPSKEHQLKNLKIPNAEIIKAINEVANGGGTRYENSEELFKALEI